MSRPRSSDVVVIGAGIVGCAVAYFMAKAGLSVTILEKGDVGGAVSGASLACIGTHMISREELPLLIASSVLWRGMEDELEADIEYQRCGQLRFIARPEDRSVAEEWVALERASGCSVEILEPGAVRKMVPSLEGDIVAATWSPNDATVNPFLACRAFTTMAQRHGATLRTQTAVRGIETASGRVSAVQTATERIPTEWVVNAAGPWAARVASFLGIGAPIRPRKAQCLATESLPPVIPCVVGACESAGGVEAGYTQIQQARSGQVLFNTVLGGGLRAEGDQDATPQIDHRFLLDSVRTLLWLFPSLDRVHLMRSWVRFEAVTPDDRFIVGPVSGLDGFLMAAGDGGTGFNRAPMFGKLLAEQVCHGAPSQSLALYAIERFDHERAA